MPSRRLPRHTSSDGSAFGLVIADIEEIVQPGERVELRLIVGVRVDLQRDRQARVAEDDLRVAGRNA